MKIIRKNVFETNSSSCHALSISKEVNDENYSLDDSLDHDYEFGRDECRLVQTWDEKLAYSYMIVKEFKDKDTIKMFKDNVNEIYDNIYKIVKYKPFEVDPKPNDIFKSIDTKKRIEDCCYHSSNDFYPYVDHMEDFKDNGFLDKILTDKDFLMRFLFSHKSYITVGSDEERGYNLKTIGFEYDYEDKYINNGTEEEPDYVEVGKFWDKLEEYKKDNDVFLKGN
jgi:hypothetical protein